MSPEYKRLKIPVYKSEKQLQRSGQGGTWNRYVIVLIGHVSKVGAIEIIAKLSSLVPSPLGKSFVVRNIVLQGGNYAISAVKRYDI